MTSGSEPPSGGPAPELWVGPRVRPEPPPPRAQKSSPIGWIILSMFAGAMIGGSCSTCLGAAGGMRDDIVAGSRELVGVIELTGEIMDSTEVVKQIRDFARREDLRAIVVRINSPGGAVAPSQDIYDALRSASKKKPVVASMGTVAASGGFWAAMAGDWVFAQPGTVTGSIGVLSQIVDLRGLAELVRVKVHTFKSGPYKDTGNPFRELTKPDEEIFDALITDVYDQFVTIVAERRKMDLEKVKALADGRIMTGRAALRAGLIDELGGLTEASRKAIVLADLRKEEPTRTSTVVPDDLEDPTLIYPTKPRSLFDILTEGAKTSISDGIAGGVDRAARSLGEAEVELK